MAVKVVEAQLMRGIGGLRQLLLDPPQRLLGLARELQLDQIGPGIRDGDGERESEGAEHPGPRGAGGPIPAESAHGD